MLYVGSLDSTFSRKFERINHAFTKDTEYINQIYGTLEIILNLWNIGAPLLSLIAISICHYSNFQIVVSLTLNQSN